MSDPLDLIRSAVGVAKQEGNPLSQFTFLDQASVEVDSVLQAQTVKIGETTLDKSLPTRLARSRDELAARIQAGSPPLPDSEPLLFYSVEAVIFGLQARDERPGAYLAQSATAKVASFSALDRAAILDYLLGRRAEWAGVLSIGAVTTATKQATVAAEDVRAGTATQVTATPATSSTKRPYQVNKTDVELVKRIRTQYEVVLRTRNDALRGNASIAAGGASVSRIAAPKSTDFESFRRTFSSKVEAARKLAGRSAPAAAPASTAAKSSSGQVRKQRAQDPIVVISNSPTSLLNMFNIKQYLEEGIFVHPEEARQRARGVADLVVSITSRGGATMPGQGVGIGRRLLVVDNAEAVNRLAASGATGAAADPWNRVVAVFTTGQGWQFKAYKWNDPKELFKNAMGVYVRWHNEPQNPNIRDWNVTELQVDRTKRHTDKQVVSHFWRQLESWTQRKKPHLIA